MDEKIDPQLVVDGQQLEANGFIRAGDRVRGNLRVVIEIARQPGDVTFQTSTALDPLADVQAAVINRQALFITGLDRALTAAQRAGVRILFPLELQYMLVAEVASLETLRALAGVPGLKYVWKDNLNRALTNEGRALTGSAAQAAAGHTGVGVGVAVIDTHFDLLHSELGGSETLPNPVVKGGQNVATPGASVHSRVVGDCYHGTGVASIVRRYAPDCHLYALVVFPAGSQFANDSDVATAINWCVIRKNGTGGGYPIKVITMSLGGGRYYSPVTAGLLHAACGTALANGILCFAASANDGWTDSIAHPAASTNCISVGSTWDANNAPYTPFPPANCAHPNRLVDQRACYSNTASFLDIYCPSEEVVCARCGGGTAPLGGTSSATPAAAGLTAQMLQARPHWEGNPGGLVALYHSTGATVAGDTSKRRINLTAAIAAGAGTERSLYLLAPPVLGQTGSFVMRHPFGAAGNFYAFLWSAPPFRSVVPVVVPGFTVNGFARIDPFNFVSVFSGVLGPAGFVTHGVAVPNNPTLVGYSWDLQTVDLGGNTLTLSDNELSLTVAAPLGGTPIPNMVPIAAGSFQMGSNAGPPDYVAPYYSSPTERPVHTVTITRPFWMGKYEVTQAEYQARMGSNPSSFQGASWPNSSNRPVETVSWNDAMAYCAALTAQEAAAGRLPTGYQYRLPTEAEWEYCCRAGTTTEFHYGSSLFCGQARFGYSYHSNSFCGGNSTVVVGGYAPNAWGLYDMHGNVWEWCLDWWDGTNNYPAGPVSDPYVTSGPYRVFRGGSWGFYSDYCRSAYRYRYNPAYGNGHLGFRVVLAPVLVP